MKAIREEKCPECNGLGFIDYEYWRGTIPNIQRCPKCKGTKIVGGTTMLSQEKKKEVRSQFKRMLKDTEQTLGEMLVAIEHSGALSDDLKAPDNYLLAKAIFDIWCQKRQYSGLSDVTRKEFANLAHFI